jgi:hypothetical protein
MTTITPSSSITAHALSATGGLLSFSLKVDTSWPRVYGCVLVDFRALLAFQDAFATLSSKDREMACNVIAFSSMSLGEAQHLVYENQCADQAERSRYYFRFPGSHLHRGHCHRRIHTMAERRMVKGRMAEEGEPAWRGRRRNLPNAWDDLMIANRGIRSWKRHRQTQWKIKNR